jgi:hypothetical protein
MAVDADMAITTASPFQGQQSPHLYQALYSVPIQVRSKALQTRSLTLPKSIGQTLSLSNHSVPGAQVSSLLAWVLIRNCGVESQ